jgi:predicted nucleic acid-binding protein
MIAWARTQLGSTFLTCPITELGFVRVAAQARVYGYTITQAKDLLLALKKGPSFQVEFVVDSHDASRLPAWVSTSGQTTDGHLVELAKAHSAILATLDEGIPGAFLVP